MRFVEMIFALAEKGCRVGFYEALGGSVSFVVCDEKGNLLASYSAQDEDELTKMIADAWRNYG